jgi:hypothetical protein
MFAIRRLLPLGALLSLVMQWTPTAAHMTACHFELGFEVLASQLPEVGQCASDQRFEYTWSSAAWVVTDAVQDTDTPSGGAGLLTWRKADNWTGFTDDVQTWVNGPNGIERRLNADPPFPWEGSPSPSVGPDGAPVANCVEAGWFAGWLFCGYPDGSFKVWNTEGHLMGLAQHGGALIALTNEGRADLLIPG